MKKKIVIFILIMISLISLGVFIKFYFFSNQNNEVIDEDLVKYEGISNLIVEQKLFLTASQYYDLKVEATLIDNDTYRYYVILTNNKIAMYDVVMVAKEFDDYDSDYIMMPSKGIFEDSKYHLIPYQYEPDKGYIKGIVLSGTKDVLPGDPLNLDLRVYVEWFSEDRTTKTTEMLQLIFTNAEGSLEY